MARMKMLDVARLAHSRWGVHGQDVVAAAIAVAWVESTHDPNAENPCCVGLWQINADAHRLSRSKLKDPVYNADKAFEIWRNSGNTFTPDWRDHWPASGHRRYRMILPRAKRAAARVAGDTSTVAGAMGRSTFNPLLGAGEIFEGAGDVAGSAITGWVDDLRKAMIPVLLNGALATTGLALMGYGVAKLAGSGKAGEAVKKGAPIAAGTAKAAS
jgi:hypothetical protein